MTRLPETVDPTTVILESSFAPDTIWKSPAPQQLWLDRWSSFSIPEPPITLAAARRNHLKATATSLPAGVVSDCAAMIG
ncbi:MAG TPA: hypothetical protein VE485_00080 [Mycobacterium sp.]|nr:hypothetical protein [Mycobacterium sp.]